MLRKDEIAAELIRDGYVGAALELEAMGRAAAMGIKPYDTAESRNTLVNGGTNLILSLLIGTGTAYTNAVSALGVGDSAAAFALTRRRTSRARW